ncbi:MAG TPA: hypothetical protein VD902_00400 [Symbiobacteriaceae bacterium]|nr:hypothetical protein [Symbiobacteriaceae bacterium]
MLEYFKGAGLSLVINVGTMIGWMYLGVWIPSVVNALLALLILGLYGLEDRWAFPGGYWTVQLLCYVVWLSGMGYAGQLSF